MEIWTDNAHQHIDSARCLQPEMKLVVFRPPVHRAERQKGSMLISHYGKYVQHIEQWGIHCLLLWAINFNSAHIGGKVTEQFPEPQVIVMKVGFPVVLMTHQIPAIIVLTRISWYKSGMCNITGRCTDKHTTINYPVQLNSTSDVRVLPISGN